mmetsp:Transcript_69368/g.154712  ORF Transcript_69368/g.154712 Transcript_69368/m.154712 type:complete len:204 (+) Transcript_69368:736-1347(+)
MCCRHGASVPQRTRMFTSLATGSVSSSAHGGTGASNMTSSGPVDLLPLLTMRVRTPCRRCFQKPFPAPFLNTSCLAVVSFGSARTWPFSTNPLERHCAQNLSAKWLLFGIKPSVHSESFPLRTPPQQRCARDISSCRGDTTGGAVGSFQLKGLTGKSSSAYTIGRTSCSVGRWIGTLYTVGHGMCCSFRSTSWSRESTCCSSH